MGLDRSLKPVSGGDSFLQLLVSSHRGQFHRPDIIGPHETGGVLEERSNRNVSAMDSIKFNNKSDGYIHACNA